MGFWGYGLAIQIEKIISGLAPAKRKAEEDGKWDSETACQSLALAWALPRKSAILYYSLESRKRYLPKTYLLCISKAYNLW